jgi:O-antigen/teichoic acid export membrane protein
VRRLRAGPWVLSAAGNLSVGVVGIATSIILARTLGPAGRGELTEAMLWPTLVLTLGGLVNTQSVVYFWARSSTPEEKSTVLGSALVSCIVLTVVLLPAAWVVDAVALASAGKASFAVANFYALSIPFSLLLLAVGGVFLAEERLVQFWGMRVANGLLFLVGLAALLAVRRVSVMSCALAALVALAVPAAFAVLPGVAGLPRRLSWDRGLAQRMAGFGLKSNLAGLPYQFNLRLDQLFMSVMLPAGVLGIYVVAFAWSSMLSFIGGGISSVMLSRSAATDASDRRGVTILTRQFRVVAVLVTAGGVLVAAATPLAIPLLFGREFVAAVVPGVILSAAGVVLNINIVLHELIRGLGHPGVGVRAESVGVGVTVALLLALLPRWGPAGAAVAALVSHLTVFGALVWLTSRRLGLSPASFLKPTAADVLHLRSGLARLWPAPGPWGSGQP